MLTCSVIIDGGTNLDSLAMLENLIYNKINCTALWDAVYERERT